jgi:hypothetical protein
MAEWMYISIFSWPRHWLEMSGQIYAPAALPPGKVPPIGGWVDLRVGLDTAEKRKFLTLPGLELRPLGRPPRSQALYWLRYFGTDCYKILNFHPVYSKYLAIQKNTNITFYVFLKAWWFVCGLLYGALSITAYTASNGRMIDEWWHGKYLEWNSLDPNRNSIPT